MHLRLRGKGSCEAKSSRKPVKGLPLNAIGLWAPAFFRGGWGYNFLWVLDVYVMSWQGDIDPTQLIYEFGLLVWFAWFNVNSAEIDRF